jgi:hypothetical protein
MLSQNPTHPGPTGAGAVGGEGAAGWPEHVVNTHALFIVRPRYCTFPKDSSRLAPSSTHAVAKPIPLGKSRPKWGCVTGMKRNRRFVPSWNFSRTSRAYTPPTTLASAAIPPPRRSHLSPTITLDPSISLHPYCRKRPKGCLDVLLWGWLSSRSFAARRLSLAGQPVSALLGYPIGRTDLVFDNKLAWPLTVGWIFPG